MLQVTTSRDGSRIETIARVWSQTLVLIQSSVPPEPPGVAAVIHMA